MDVAASVRESRSTSSSGAKLRAQARMHVSEPRLWLRRSASRRRQAVEEGVAVGAACGVPVRRVAADGLDGSATLAVRWEQRCEKEAGHLAMAAER